MKSLFAHAGVAPAALLSMIVLAVGCSPATQRNARIVDVNEEAATIIALTGDEQVTYDVAPEANITLDNEPAELKELSEGDRMNVELEDRGGLSVAMRIDATSQDKIPVEDSANDTDPPHPLPLY